MPREEVKYGDEILIYDSDKVGYMTCRRQKMAQIMIETLNVKPRPGDIYVSPPEPLDCKFRVVPKLAFSKFNALNKTKKIISSSKADKIAKAKQAHLEEQSSNRALEHKMRGTPISFGSAIMLLHVKTNAYLCVYKERADKDSGKLKLALDDEGNKNCWFKLNIGYKSSKMGDSVVYPAVFTLLSIKNDINVHVSTAREAPTGLMSPHPYVQDILECNAYVQATKFSIIPFTLVDGAVSEAAQRLDENTLKTAVPITLFHTDSGSQLVVKNGRCQYQKVDPSANFNSAALFMVLSNASMYGGSKIDAGSSDTFRIHHMMTGMALTASDFGSEVGLEMEFVAESAQWRIQLQGQGKRIFIGSQVIVQTSSKHFLRPVEGGDSEANMDAYLSPSGLDRDVLVVVRPDSSQIEILVKVQELGRRIMNTKLRMFAAIGKGTPSTKAVQVEMQTMGQLYSTLTLLCTKGVGDDPFTKDGPPDTVWQDTMAEQRIECLSIDLVTSIFDFDDPDVKTVGVTMQEMEAGMCGEHAIKCIMTVFRFLKMFMKDNLNNKRLVMKHMDFILAYLPYKFQTVDTMAEVYLGNREALDGMTEKLLSRLVVLLKAKHRTQCSGARFVDLLRGFCTWNGVPLVNNQNAVLDNFLSDESLHLPVEFRQLKGKGHMPHLYSALDDEWIALIRFAGRSAQILAKPINACTMEEKVYRYNIQSMRLFVDLCKGRNRKATDFLLERADTFGLAYKDLLATIQNDAVPPMYRGLVCNVIIALYVDREPCEDVQPVRSVYIWNRVASTTPIVKTIVDPFKAFPHLKPTPGFTDIQDFLLGFFAKVTRFNLDDPNTSALQASLVSFCYTLLSFGFYHEDGVADLKRMSTLMDPLLDLLDGRPDADVLDRYLSSPKTNPVFEAKCLICRVLEFIFDCRQDKRLRMAFELYERATESALDKGKLELADDVIVGDTPWRQQELDELNDTLFNKPMISKKVAMSADIEKPPDFVLILLDCMQCQHVGLSVTTLSLLNRHFGQRTAMIKKMLSLQIVAFNEVAELFGEVTSHVSELRRNKKWLNSPDDAGRTKGFAAVTTVLDRWLELLQLHQEVELGGNTIVVGATELVKFQSMFINLGALAKLLDILTMSTKNISEEMYALYIKIYDFLCAVCDGHEANQKILYAQQKHYLAHMPDETLSPQVAKLMATILKENKALNEKLEEALIARVFKFLNNSKVGAWLDFLTTICQLDNARIARHSASVMKFVAAYPNLLETYGGTAGRRQLVAALGGGFEAMDWHLASLRLLTINCLGRAADNEIKVQGMISWRDCTQNMLALKLAPQKYEEVCAEPELWVPLAHEIKTTYMNFLLMVYLTSESDDASQQIESPSARIWPNIQWEPREMDEDGAILMTEDRALFLFQRAANLYLLRFAGMNVTWSQLYSPRTVTQEMVEALIRLIQMSKKESGEQAPGRKKKKKKNKVTDDSRWTQVPEEDVTAEDCRNYAMFVSKHVMPWIFELFSRYFHMMAEDQVQKSVGHTLVSLVKHCLVLKWVDSDGKSKMASFITLMIEKGFEIQFEAPPLAVVAPMSDKAKFKNCFSNFTIDLAATLGITDLKRVLGVGVKNFARLLALDIVPNVSPKLTYQQVVYQIFQVLCDRPPQLQDALLIDMLRVTRCIVYMLDPGDPEGKLQDENWVNYQKDGPVQNTAPAVERLNWVQSKYIKLGAIVAAGRNISHNDHVVQIAALRLGITVMEFGNIEAQQKLYSDLQTRQDEKFFVALHESILDGAKAIREWRVDLKSAEEKECPKARAKGLKVASDVAFKQFSDCMLSFRFTQLLMEGHNESFQNYLREQTSHANSYNIIGASVALLDAMNSQLEFCFTGKHTVMFPLMKQVLCTMTEAMQGSCFQNQLELSSNFVAVLFRKLFLSLHYSSDHRVDDVYLDMKGAQANIRTLKCRLKGYLLITFISILEDNYDTKLGATMLANFDAADCYDEILHVFEGWEEEAPEGQEPILSVLDQHRRLDNEENPDLLVDVTGMLQGEDDEDVTMFVGSVTHGITDKAEVADLKEQAYQTYLFLKYLEDREPLRGQYDPPGPYKMAVKDVLGLPCGPEIRYNTATVEICRHHWEDTVRLMDPATMYRIHFLVPKFFLDTTEKSLFLKHMHEVIDNVPRGNPTEKSVTMLKRLNFLTFEMSHLYKLTQDKYCKPLVDYSDAIQNPPLLSAMVSWILTMIFYGEHSDPYAMAPAMEWVNRFVIFIHFCLASFWCSSYCVVEAPILLGIKLPDPPPPVKYVYIDPLTPAYELPLDPVPEPPVEETEMERLERRLTVAIFSIQPIVFTLFSFLGVVHSPFWTFFWALNYLRLPWGAVTLRAFLKAGPPLTMVLAGAGLLMTLWTSWSFIFFYNDVDYFMEKKYKAEASTVYRFMLNGFNAGFRGDLSNSWGPGFHSIKKHQPIVPLPEHFYESPDLMVQWLLTMAYNLIWTFIYLAVTKSIIVSTFQGIVAAENLLKNDAANFCLMCTMKRFDLDQDAGGFIMHKKNHHNPLDYLALLLKVNTGQVDELTGIEENVKDRAAEGDNTFLPIERCVEIQKLDRRKEAEKLSRQAESEQNASGAKDQHDALMKRVKKVNTQMSQPVEEISRFNRRMERLENRITDVCGVMESLIQQRAAG